MSIEDFGTAVTNRSVVTEIAQSSPVVPPEKSSAKNYLENFGSQLEVYKCWSIHSPKKFVPSGQTFGGLAPGVYKLFHSNIAPIIFEIQDTMVDDLMEFPDSLSDDILKEIDLFWDRAEKFKYYGFLQRRGYLLYGPAGSGKTSIVQLVIHNIIKKGGLVIICENPPLLNIALGIFRQIEKDRPIVCLFEDIDAIIKTHGESNLLAVLDGEFQTDRVLNIATTNYPELLDPRIVARPRRFDRVIKIDMPNKAVRSAYFSRKLKLTNGDVEKWASATDGFSFAAMAELVISVKCLGNSFESALETLRSLMKSKASSDQFKTATVGFK